VKLTLGFFRSKVAYRIFILFIICALIPIIALAIVSFSQVTQQLDEQSRVRLRHVTKTIGMGIYERLLNAEGQMKLVASNMALGPGAANGALSQDLIENQTERFKGLTLIAETGKQVPIFGVLQHTPALTAKEKEFVSSGQTLLTSQLNPGSPAHIFMILAFNPKKKEQGFLWGEINPVYLWDTDEKKALPPMTEFCILDQSRNVLYHSAEFAESIPQRVAAALNRSGLGQFDAEHEGQDYLVGYWSIFLQPKFLIPRWTVALTQLKSDALAPVANFKKVFPFVIFLSLLVVLLLSILQIRRSLIPLEKLQEGTRQIAQRDFDSRVTIKSGDEFEDLAASFNAMASQLGMQFKTLTTMGEIDRQILSTLETKKIVTNLLGRMPEVLPCDCIAVTLVGSDDQNSGETYFRETKLGSNIQMETTQVTAKFLERLKIHEESFLITDEGITEDFSFLAKIGIKSCLVLPIFRQGRLAAVILLGYPARPEFVMDDLVRARQVANQIAVALSNANLINELHQLNLGTLTALARAIDAKSPWTAGHSERVTKLAMKIGQALGFGSKELELLNRGALLHDTGKVGIPAAILDKPGKLTDEEMELMKRHSQIGARILEPIISYSDTIPMVLQHHEKYDGTGYPYGISGEAINLNARILAIADVFDAITSVRPYRSAMDLKTAVNLIKGNAGSHFDPKVVEAFLQVVALEEQAGREINQ
jgi:putative nucleotidyltransferase with HDIG domain